MIDLYRYKKYRDFIIETQEYIIPELYKEWLEESKKLYLNKEINNEDLDLIYSEIIIFFKISSTYINVRNVYKHFSSFEIMTFKTEDLFELSKYVRESFYDYVQFKKDEENNEKLKNVIGNILIDGILYGLEIEFFINELNKLEVEYSKLRTLLNNYEVFSPVFIGEIKNRLIKEKVNYLKLVKLD